MALPFPSFDTHSPRPMATIFSARSIDDHAVAEHGGLSQVPDEVDRLQETAHQKVLVEWFSTSESTPIEIRGSSNTSTVCVHLAGGEVYICSNRRSTHVAK